MPCYKYGGGRQERTPDALMRHTDDRGHTKRRLQGSAMSYCDMTASCTCHSQLGCEWMTAVGRDNYSFACPPGYDITTTPNTGHTRPIY